MKEINDRLKERRKTGPVPHPFFMRGSGGEGASFRENGGNTAAVFAPAE